MGSRLPCCLRCSRSYLQLQQGQHWQLGDIGSLQAPTITVSSEGVVALAWGAAAAPLEEPGYPIRAAAGWEGAPWFDCISVRFVTSPAGVAAGDAECGFAQLRLLVTYSSGDFQVRLIFLHNRPFCMACAASVSLCGARPQLLPPQHLTTN
jgi:hypothetical protein